MIEKARLLHSFREKASQVVATKAEKKTQSVHSVCDGCEAYAIRSPKVEVSTAGSPGKEPHKVGQP